MNLIKLTDTKGYTQNNVHWYPSKKLTLPIKNNPQLCTSDVIHAYKSLNLALLVNPIHGEFNNPRIFKAVGDIVVEDKLKVGCFELTTLEEIRQPLWYRAEKVRRKVQLQFAILCAKEVLPLFEKKYPKDLRPRKAIKEAEKVLKDIDAHAADAAYAAYAAYAAAHAAYAATHVTHAAYAAYATAYAAYAAYAAYTAYTAYAAHAANAAAHADITINFNKLADEAVRLQG